MLQTSWSAPDFIFADVCDHSVIQYVITNYL